MIALGDPWPAPVAPREPKSSAVSRWQWLNSCSCSSDSAKRRAACIGPTVWELEGPIPTLKRSNVLIDMTAPDSASQSAECSPKKTPPSRCIHSLKGLFLPNRCPPDFALSFVPNNAVQTPLRDAFCTDWVTRPTGNPKCFRNAPSLTRTPRGHHNRVLRSGFPIIWGKSAPQDRDSRLLHTLTALSCAVL